MNKKYLLILLLLFATSLACTLPFMGSGDEAQSGDVKSSGNTVDFTESENALPSVDTDSYVVRVENVALLEPVALSTAQRQILKVKGPPNRFLIMFSDGLREETWYYDHLGYQVTLRNGDIYTENGNGTPVDTVDFVSVYYPWQFNGQMGLNELLAISEAKSFAVESLEDTFQEDLSLVYLHGLDVGFKGEQILYIRAIPLGSGASNLPVTIEATEAIGQPDSESDLMPIIQTHEGARTYQMTCMYSDGTSESYTDTINWEFSEEGLYFNGDGPFPKIAENYYGLQDETGDYFFMFSMNMVVLSGSFFEADEDGNPVTSTFSCTLIPE